MATILAKLAMPMVKDMVMGKKGAAGPGAGPGAGPAGPAGAAGAAGAKKKDLFKMLAEAIMKVVEFVNSLPQTIFSFITGARVFLAACIFLVILVLILYIVYLMATYMHPRILLLSHSDSTFDSSMDTRFRQTAATMNDLRLTMMRDGAMLWGMSVLDLSAYKGRVSDRQREHDAEAERLRGEQTINMSGMARHLLDRTEQFDQHQHVESFEDEDEDIHDGDDNPRPRRPHPSAEGLVRDGVTETLLVRSRRRNGGGGDVVEKFDSSTDDPQVDGVGYMQSTVNLMQTALDKLSRRTDLATDLRLYFQYSRSLSQIDVDKQIELGVRGYAMFSVNTMPKLDLKNEPQFLNLETNSLNLKNLANFYLGAFKPLCTVRTCATELSRELQTLAGTADAPWYTSDMARIVLGIHQLRMFLDDFHDQINLAYETRKPSSITAIWQLYWWPRFQPCEKTVEHTFKGAPHRFNVVLNNTMTWWELIGVKLALTPCKAAYEGDPEGLAKNCSLNSAGINAPQMMDADTFVQGDDGKAAAQAEISSINASAGPLPEQANSDVQPSMGGDYSTSGGDFQGSGHDGGGLSGMLSGINAIFGVIVPMATAFASAIGQIQTNPSRTLKILLLVPILYVLVFILEGFFVLWTLLIALPIAISVAWIMSFVRAIVVAILYYLWGGLLAVPYLLLWIPDYLMNGFIVRLMRCEEAVGAWETTPDWAHGNGYSSMGLLCGYPCTDTFHPALGGTVCLKRPDQQPAFCPQQQVSRLYHGESVEDTWIFDRFLASAVFKAMSVDGQRKAVLDMYRDKVKFLGSCYDALGDKDYMTSHICANLDRLPASAGISAGAKLQIQKLCSQVYCDFRPGHGEGKKAHEYHPNRNNDAPNPSFCRRLALTKAHNVPAGDAAAKLGAKAVMACLVALSTLVLLYALLAAPNAGSGPARPVMSGPETATSGKTYVGVASLQKAI